MKHEFKYVGPHDAVDLPGVGVDIERGHSVEVTGEVAESLSQQTDWQRVDKPKTRTPEPKTPATSATKTED